MYVNHHALWQYPSCLTRKNSTFVRNGKSPAELQGRETHPVDRISPYATRTVRVADTSELFKFNPLPLCDMHYDDIIYIYSQSDLDDGGHEIHRAHAGLEPGLPCCPCEGHMLAILIENNFHKNWCYSCIETTFTTNTNGFEVITQMEDHWTFKNSFSLSSWRLWVPSPPSSKAKEARIWVNKLWV